MVRLTGISATRKEKICNDRIRLDEMLTKVSQREKGELDMYENLFVKAIRLSVLLVTLCSVSGCSLFMSYYQMVDKEFKKSPRHVVNVPPKAPLPIDGIWSNPYDGQNYFMDRGRIHLIDRGTRELPGFPMVVVKDIERVAPGRYRGTSMLNPGWRVTYSIVAKDKLLERTFKKDGYMDVVYDMVWSPEHRKAEFVKEYEAFLRESHAGGVGSHTGPTQTARPSGDGTSGQTKEVSARPSIVVYKMHTKPEQIIPGTRFDLIIEYAVTDPSVQANRIPVTFNLEILKTKNTFQASNLNEPAYPTPDNTDKVHTFKPVNIDCPNGKKTSRIVHLLATKDKGSYYMVAYLKYKGWTKKLSMHLPIN